jgi:hypothetical protein
MSTEPKIDVDLQTLLVRQMQDGKIGRLRALEDAAGVDTGLAIGTGWLRSRRSASGAFEIYSLIVRTTLEVGRVSGIGPFNCFRMASS